MRVRVVVPDTSLKRQRRETVPVAGASGLWCIGGAVVHRRRHNRLRSQRADYGVIDNVGAVERATVLRQPSEIRNDVASSRSGFAVEGAIEFYARPDYERPALTQTSECNRVPNVKTTRCGDSSCRGTQEWNVPECVEHGSGQKGAAPVQAKLESVGAIGIR